MLDPVTTYLPPSVIRTDESFWPRDGLSQERVEEFMDLYADNGPTALPALEVVTLDGEEYLLTDGWHRLEALERLDVQSVMVCIVDPGREDPWQFAYRRGLETCVTSSRPLTRAERRAAVTRLVAEHPDWTDVSIARLTGVSNATVGRVRHSLFNENPSDADLDAPAARTHTDCQTLSRRVVRGLAELWKSRPALMSMGLQDSDRLGDYLGDALLDAYDADEAAAWAQRLEAWAARAHAVATSAVDGAR